MAVPRDIRFVVMAAGAAFGLAVLGGLLVTSAGLAGVWLGLLGASGIVGLYLGRQQSTYWRREVRGQDASYPKGRELLFTVLIFIWIVSFFVMSELGF